MSVDIICPKCELDECLSVLCWVAYVNDGSGDHGTVLETAGNFNIPPEQEPPQLILCGNCNKYFSPEDIVEHGVLDIEDGKPILVVRKPPV